MPAFVGRTAEELRRLSEQRAEISVEALAKYLAWSDRAMGITCSSPRFIAGADRYWEQMSPNNCGAWLALAASLLGLAMPREVRDGWGREGSEKMQDRAFRASLQDGDS